MSGRIRPEYAEFERLCDEPMAERKREYARCFAAIDRVMEANRFEETTEALADLALLFGHELAYGTFAAFDRATRNPGLL